MEPLPSTLYPHNARNGNKEQIETSETLSGYAALSRDETAGQDEDWQHLNRDTAQAGEEESDAASPRSSEASREVSRTSSSQHSNTSSNHIRANWGTVERPATVAGYNLPASNVPYTYATLGTTLSSHHADREVWSFCAFNNPPASQGPLDFSPYSAFQTLGGAGVADLTTPTRADHINNSSYTFPKAVQPRHGTSTFASSAYTSNSRLPASRTLQEQLEDLKEENERLRQEHQGTSIPSQNAVPWAISKTFYQIGGTFFLDEPHWEPTEGGSALLRASSPIRNIDHYLDQHPGLAFAIYKKYDPLPPADHRKIEDKAGAYIPPVPSNEYLRFITRPMQDAIEAVISRIHDFDDYFPGFEPRDHVPAPYLFMYYSAPFIPDILADLDQSERNLITQLYDTIKRSYGTEYKAAKDQASRGFVSPQVLKYLIRPGDVLISNTGNDLQAYKVKNWILNAPSIQQNSTSQHTYSRKKRMSKNAVSAENGVRDWKTYTWVVPVWRWAFDGVFSKEETSLHISMTTSYDEEFVSITTLNAYPLEKARRDIRIQLKHRGETFWSLRRKKFIYYALSYDETQHNIGARHMVDTEAYKKLFPHSWVAQSRLQDAIGETRMNSDEPLEGDDLLLFPPTIMGYNLQDKAWRTLWVDCIKDVKWSKTAFDDLVAEADTKELVKAVVMNQIDTKKSTDFISGKGNGLIMLLHGAPGTGKTFTAEGVAEFAEKPLLRVTCGDIGTLAETVDQRLRATLKLGKMWDCVVLLDEADVFLEVRDTKDLNRNALVSVFLRQLEYYDGILILTSNRVGDFDEAFKSRIQLALHYENLGEPQRKKIWRNFLNRLESVEDEEAADVEDIRDHIDELSKKIMNGREIRNALTIARQLALARKERFQYSHLKHAIDVVGKFSTYLEDLHDKLTDDQIKQVDGVRWTYQNAPPGPK